MRYISASEEQKEADFHFYREVLRSNECQCERGKQPGMLFCYRCYVQLPAEMRRALLGGLNADTIEAYDEAVAWID